jgi:hypothetical protein
VNLRKQNRTINIKKITASLLIFILFVQLLPLVNFGEATSPSTWYVSPTGNNRNSGNITHPFQTVQKAIDTSHNGDTIYLREGTYNKISSPITGILINRIGIPDSWYTIAGYPGERVVLNGRGCALSTNYALLCIGTATQGESYIRITNIVLENSSQDGIRVAQQGTHTSHHIRIDNCTINNCMDRGLLFWSTNPNRAWCHNLTVENCTITKTQTSYSMGEGVTFSGCKDVSFHHNTITNCPKIMLDFANNTKNCAVYKNTIVTTQGTGIKLDGSQSTTVSAWDENISIYNNNFSGTYTAIKIGVEKKGGCKNISIYNNIINTKSSYPGLKLEGVTGYTQRLETIVIKQNTIQVSGAGSPLQIELPQTKLRNLNSTSPAIDAADPAYTVPFDYDGQSRPQNTFYDIGAYEYDTIPPMPPTPPLPPTPPTITTVRITPSLQHMGRSLNISCEIVDPSKSVDNVWVTITSPDTTTQNYTMSPAYYLNQTYTQTGTYRFVINVHDTNNNTNTTMEYMFTIIPVLTTAFIAGFITMEHEATDSLFSAKAILILYIELNPLTITVLSSDETLFIAKQSIGYIGANFIIGAFNTAVLS